jgi:hypothetical protein
MRKKPPLVAGALLAAFALFPALPGAAADPEERATILATVDEVAAEISRVRGLPWKRRVEAELLTRAELKERLGEMLREDLDEAEMEKTVRALRRYGMLGEEEDLLALFQAMLGEGILAYYDPETGKIYVVLGPEPDALRPTIAHELVHALEDQYVGIEDAQAAVEDRPDALFALTCVVEGSAERGRALWEVENPGLARRARTAKDDPRLAEAMRTVLAKTPAYLILPTQFHYQRGISFVERATLFDYAGGIDRLYRDPPTTQEQILHPDRYAFPGATARGLRDVPRRIHWVRDPAEAAGPGWSLLDDEESGELDFALWIDFFLGTCGGKLDMDLLRRGEWCAPEAERSSEGWDGARAAFLRKDGFPLGIVSASAWDSETDAREAADATYAALEARWKGSFQGDSAWTTTKERSGLSVRAREYRGGGFRGRVEVREDLLLWLETEPASFPRVLEALRWTVAERDPRDLRDAVDPSVALAGADWTSSEHGVGWKRPDAEWVAESKSEDRAAFRKGPVSVSIRALPGPMANALRSLPSGLAMRVRNGVVTPEEATLRGRDGMRLAYDSREAEGLPGTRHVVLVVPLPKDKVLFLHARSPVSAKARYAVDVERAIDGVLVAQ